MFEGSDVIMTLSNPQISTKSDYNVFRINNVGSSIIHHLTIKEYASQSYTLELNNVTSLDAGYYGIGADEMESRSSNGVVLVIKGMSVKTWFKNVFQHVLLKEPFISDYQYNNLKVLTKNLV